MEFRYPYLFLLVVPVAILWLLDFWKIFKKSELVSAKTKRIPSWKYLLKIVLTFIGISSFILIGVAIMQPRKSQKISPSSMQVNDVVLTVDVSRSMLANDIQPNRLEVAKDKLRDFAKLRPTDRIALVIFSEKVFTLLPLTTDPTLLDKVLSQINIGYLGSGTNIGDALGLSVARASSSETKNKVIVLLTDGVSNVGNLTPMQAAEEAKKHGIKVYTIGFGTDDGNARIPVGQGILGTQYQMIPGGSIDYKSLQDIAKLTGGKFYPATSEGALAEVLNDIQNLEKTEIKVNSQIVYDEKFYVYLFWGGLLFLLTEILKILILKDII
jgi:Ca-activated chloride channel family protein